MLGYLLIAIGFVLLIVECFIPGFGPLGIGGLILLFIGAWLFTGSLRGAALLTIIMFAAATVLGLIIFKILKRLKVWDMIKLDSSNEAVDDDCGLKLGDEGVALTALRPVGVARFGKEKKHVQSKSQFIQSGEHLRVIGIEKGRILVEKIDQK